MVGLINDGCTDQGLFGVTKTCAFLTMENPEGFFVYDHLAVEPLKKIGWETVEVPWSRPIHEWSHFDAVIIRSTWDYQSDPQNFLQTLKSIEQAGVPLYNSRSICEWNMDKRYLRELAERGVPLVPTIWLDSLAEDDLPHLFDQLQSMSASGQIVMKPVIGANADDTYVLDRENESDWEAPLRVFAQKPSMAQPFLDSIQHTGEYSLFYFGNAFSHAVLKTPSPGDFRVQEEHGGSIQTVEPEKPLIALGNQAMEAIGETLLYARVDLAELHDGSFGLMELELIEPSLYFSFDPDSPVRFAHALKEMVG